jgi:soluble lytic murein transglycosylase-like protein
MEMGFHFIPTLRRLAWVGLMTVTALAQADIYKFTDKYGRVHLTDRPDHTGYQLLVKTWKGWTPRLPILSGARLSGNLSLNRRQWAATVARAASLYQLPDSLLHAVITAESAYNPNAVSRAGAVGMMQLMPETAQRYGVSDRRDAEANIHGGSRYLRDLLGMFKNNIELAVAAYNAGEGAVMQYGNHVPPYAETQTYVRKVLELYRRYQTSLM